MDTLTVIMIVLHLILAAFLILFVLLHRGQGGGLSDMFGGGSGGGLQGSAVVERNLDRLTVLSALAFTATNITLVAIY
ncbi:preprotein translocase subunit SecG [Nitriliruptor alkaliphilus]|uniref:preprotein translocase subunit SecG n=1 Tax=Nitriliruptor alkaliphilus TaxID=427918 RepID=UPI000B10DD78|nr:preprotein translocase subunit SecG [Nitriliruptor alkaliphilus]